MFGNVGPSELLLVGLVLFLILGGKKLPELTHGIIDRVQQFRRAFREGEKAADGEDKDDK